MNLINNYYEFKPLYGFHISVVEEADVKSVECVLDEKYVVVVVASVVSTSVLVDPVYVDAVLVVS